MNKPWLLAEVVLNVPLHSSFYYIIPDHLKEVDLCFRRVNVLFGKREEVGFVLNITNEDEIALDLSTLDSVKEIEDILDIDAILTTELIELGKKVSEYYHAPIGEVFFTMFPPFKTPKKFHNPYTSQTKSFEPNSEQQKAFDVMKEFVGSKKTFLLQGITGSGKTEVYKMIAQECLNQNKGAIILVPEIALTDQTLKRFSQQFGDKIALFHSKLNPAERTSEWFRVLKGDARLVIGPRSAIFAPVKDLGLIIIDEEHDPSYKSMDSPRYHARGIAFMRSKEEQALLILGSATPSIETKYASEQKIITPIILSHRFGETKLPSVEIIDLKKEKTGNNFLSEKLFTYLVKTLKEKKQTLIFLNRRGFAPSMLCQDCGFFFKCPHCDIGMTWYKKDCMIKCKYCEFSDAAPEICPECSGYQIKDIGHGTEKLEEQLQNLLPSGRILRLDIDTARKKNSATDVLKAMQNHEADILVGTQMIAKGHDIANIELVGALFPEIMLSLPDFRASERTFSLLSQAIGRCGRRNNQGHAIIQTYVGEHFAIQHAVTQDYEKFYQEEIRIRENFHYPPFRRVGKIVFRSQSEALIIELNKKLKNLIRKNKRAFEDHNIEILGPAPCPIERINNHYRYQILFKSSTHHNILNAIKYIYKHYKKFSMYDKIKAEIDIDPVQIL